MVMRVPSFEDLFIPDPVPLEAHTINRLFANDASAGLEHIYTSLQKLDFDELEEVIQMARKLQLSTSRLATPIEITCNCYDEIITRLKAMKLHKYYASFEGYHWKDFPNLDHSHLQEMGITTLGARSKILKAIREGLLCSKDSFHR